MTRLMTAVLAAALLLPGCASTGQKLAYDPEGCSLNYVAPSGGQQASGPWSSNKIRAGDPEYRTRANCVSNHALQQMSVTRLEQQRNTTVSFPPEAPN